MHMEQLEARSNIVVFVQHCKRDNEFCGSIRFISFGAAPREGARTASSAELLSARLLWGRRRCVPPGGGVTKQLASVCIEGFMQALGI